MSENTELVHINPNTALAPSGGLGLEGFQLKPTVIKLVQRTTNIEGAQPGKLLDPLANNHFDTLQAVPLSFRVGRVYFPPSGELGAEPICRSDDGIVPAPNAVSPQAAKCANCDHGDKMWKSFRQTKKKPDCQESHTMLFIARDTGLPYFITVRGASVSQLKKLKEAIYRDFLIQKGKGEPRNLYDYTFEIKPVFIQGGKGSYYVLSFSNLKRILTPGEFGPLYEEFVLRRKLDQTEIADDEVIEGELVEEASEPQKYESV
jgi:hypothetical protein